MKNLYCIPSLFILIHVCLTAYSQTNDINREIDEQVWKPFKTTYAAYDMESYNELHTDDVLRITSSGIRRCESWKKGNIEWKNQRDRSNEPRTIEFSFEHRLNLDDIAYHVGFYKVMAKNQKGVWNTSYGRFHVMLKKIDGAWKIAKDWDTGTIGGIEVTEEMFNHQSSSGN